MRSEKQLLLSPFAGHIFENMVIMDIVKQFASQGKRAYCYFYRTSQGQEVDLLIDRGDCLDAYGIKFSAMPKTEMAQSLAIFKEEQPVGKAVLLTLYPKTLLFKEGISAEHWSSIL